jgi:selenocysteine lyase/cysteine desulfurase
MEIGSEFWVDFHKIGDDDLDCEIPFWLKKFGNVVLTSSGRGAISIVLSQIEPKEKRALLPSYICESVIIPFEEAGYEVVYYDLDEYLTPKDIDIYSNDIGVFFHMGYFGFPTNKKLHDIVLELKSRSVTIIEDVTHTLFSIVRYPIYNDFVIGSIRKWFGLPSGGFLATSKTISTKLPDPPINLINLRIKSLQKKFEYIKTMNQSLKDEYLLGFRKAEQMLDLDLAVYGIDSVSKQIIQSTSIDRIQRVRKANYSYLLRSLLDINGIKVILKKIENDITPIFFPIYVESDRDKLRFQLVEKEIYCPIHWPIPNQLKGRLDSKTQNIYHSILSIPCDQRYGIDDMSRIVDTIKELI